MSAPELALKLQAQVAVSGLRGGRLGGCTWSNAYEIHPILFRDATTADRQSIKLEWIESVIRQPVRSLTQDDGRIRMWAPIADMEGRYLRVILLPDGETLHNAFFDWSFEP